MREKYAYDVRILFLPSVKNTHAEISMFGKGNIKQSSKSKNFIRICLFFTGISYFFSRKCVNTDVR